jgi:hypothetical protein
MHQPQYRTGALSLCHKSYPFRHPQRTLAKA